MSSFSVRTRFVTATTGVVSAAPAATLRTVGVDLRGPVLRHDHRKRAAGIRRAQTRAEVVRILHAIQRQDQRVVRVSQSASTNSSSVHGGSGVISATTPW